MREGQLYRAREILSLEKNPARFELGSSHTDSERISLIVELWYGHTKQNTGNIFGWAVCPYGQPHLIPCVEHRVYTHVNNISLIMYRIIYP